MKSFKGAFLASILMLMSFAAQATLINVKVSGLAYGIIDDFNLTGIQNSPYSRVAVTGEFIFDTANAAPVVNPAKTELTSYSSAPYYLKYTINNRTFDGLLGPDVGLMGNGFFYVSDNGGGAVRVASDYQSRDQTNSLNILNSLFVNFKNDQPVPNPVTFTDYYTNQSTVNVINPEIIGNGEFRLFNNTSSGGFRTSFAFDVYSIQVNPPPVIEPGPSEVPEPSSYALFALAGLLLVRSVVS